MENMKQMKTMDLKYEVLVYDNIKTRDSLIAECVAFCCHIGADEHG
jgi:hypothetical protein